VGGEGGAAAALGFCSSAPPLSTFAEGSVASVCAGRDSDGGLQRALSLRYAGPAAWADAGESDAGGGGGAGGDGSPARTPPSSLLRSWARGWRARGQLRRDMRALVAVRHPCVAAIMGVAEVRGGPQRGLCLVMELAELGSLWDLLRNPTFPLRAGAALRVLRDVAQGMRFLHAARPPILHGDLKSPNGLIDRAFGARVSDFGLAPRGAPGTPLWMAPERLAAAAAGGGEGAGAGASGPGDVWGFGVMVWEVLARRRPYEGEDLRWALAAVARGEHRLAAPAGCSGEAAAMLADCLRADPAQRPPFAELDRRLRTLEEAQFTSAAFDDDGGGGAGAGGAARRALVPGRFPKVVAEALAAGQRVPPEAKDMVSVFFSDVAGFTAMSASMPAEKVPPEPLYSHCRPHRDSNAM
jgi:serine/threonine protein kinase